MPFRDGSGPNGAGAMTGRGMGNCAPNQDQANDFNYRGRGLGRGCGMGRRNGGMRYGNRRGNGFAEFEDRQALNNKSYLESIVTYLSDKLISYKQRLEELDNK